MLFTPTFSTENGPFDREPVPWYHGLRSTTTQMPVIWPQEPIATEPPTIAGDLIDKLHLDPEQGRSDWVWRRTIARLSAACFTPFDEQLTSQCGSGVWRAR